MRRKTLGFDEVREIAMTFPDVEESTIHGAPSLKVRGKLLACRAIHRSAEPDTLAVRIGFAPRAELMDAQPDVLRDGALHELSNRACTAVTDSPGFAERSA
jgi:hypothetical protein